MGDTYCNLVPVRVGNASASDVGAKVVRHLINRKIVSDRLTDCVLGEEGGYAPGDNYRHAIDDPYDYILDQSTNGLAVNLGRQVFYAAGVDQVLCPNCKENIVDTGWEDAMDEWVNETGNDILTCPSCGHSYSITEYIFEPNWAFGELGFTFWNWGGQFKDEFIKELEQLTGSTISVVYGKL